MVRHFRLHSLLCRLAVVAMAACAPCAAAPAALANDYKVGDIRFDHPWSRATPHGAKVAGGFLVLENAGAADRLVSISSEIAEHAEIHQMSMKDGVMSMRPLPDGLAVPAGGEVALAPGGYHLTFIGLNRPLARPDKGVFGKECG